MNKEFIVEKNEKWIFWKNIEYKHINYANFNDNEFMTLANISEMETYCCEIIREMESTFEQIIIDN